MSAPHSNTTHGNSSSSQFVNIPQQAPGAHAAVGHTVNNSIPLSIFPIAMDKFCICFAGLPARGKTHMTRRLARYLEFFHAIPVKVFNYNEYRREKYGKVSNFFFDPTNVENMEKREIVYDEISAEVTQFMKSHPNAIAILDSTNATFKRRNALSEMIHATGAKMMFVEVQNNDAKSVEEHIHKIITGSPDYEGEIYDVALADFKLKVDKYKSVYESIDSGKYPIESTLNYIKCDLQTGHFIIHNIRGYLQQKVAHFIMNLRTEPHIFYLSRHGQSEYNAIGRIGGDSGLSKHGVNYAKKLADFTENVITKEPIDDSSNSSSGHNSSAALLALAAGAPGTSTWPGTGSGTGTETKESVDNFTNAGKATATGANAAGRSIFKTLMPLAERPARLWTSTMRRTKETAQFIKKSTMSIQDKHNPALVHEWIQMRPRAWHHLDELFAGSCDGMTYEEIEEQFPEEFARRSEDKLAYRYPRGESYLDVIARLEPMIIEMERHREPLLIVGHQGILRIIYAFYMGLSRSDAPYVSIPLNTVIECKPGAFACEVRKHVLYKIQLNDDGQNEPNSAGLAYGGVGDGAPDFPGNKQGGTVHDHVHDGGSSGRRQGQEENGTGCSGDGGAGSAASMEFGARKRAISAAPRYITEEEINNPHSH